MIYRDWDLELTGEHISINAITANDDEEYGRLLFGELYDSLRKQIGDKKVPTGLQTILDHSSNDETHAIRLLPENKLIGWITLQKGKEDYPDIGIYLTKEQQNRGYGPEAIQLLCNYLHQSYGLQIVKVRISAKNIQSQNAFAKVGAILDQEIPDERYMRLLEEYPEHKMADNFKMMVRYYHITLPIKEILSIEHPDDETIKKSQEAYEKEEAQLIREIQLTELESLQRKIEEQKSTSPEELRSYLENRITELRKH